MCCIDILIIMILTPTKGKQDASVKENIRMNETIVAGFDMKDSFFF